MPTYRKLHTKTLESLDVNDMPDDFTRLFWVLLPLALDREGRGLDNVAWLKSKVFPLRMDVTPERITQAMAHFAEHGMIKRYAVQGRSYFWLPTFARYQGDTIKEAASQYPAPPEETAANSGPTPELVQSKSVSDADADSEVDADADADAKSEHLPDAKPKRQRKVEGSQPGNGGGTEHQAIFGALLRWYKIDSNLMTADMQKRIGTETSRILKAGYTAADVIAGADHWWHQDWRGKKGESPGKTAFVFETLSKLKAAATTDRCRELGEFE